MAGWRNVRRVLERAAFGAGGQGGRPYRRALGAAAVAGSAAGICLRLIQFRRQAAMQSSPPLSALSGRRMPGDSVLAGPVRQRTYSIMIPASAPEIWPLLNRVGHGRAGWYLFDRLDVSGNRGPHAFAFRQQARPESGEVGIDDVLAGETGHGLRIREVQPNEWMLWGDGDARATWLWLLQPVRSKQTRLVVRARFRLPGMLASRPLEALDRATVRRCLTGIRDRAVLRSATQAAGVHRPGPG